MSDDADRPRDEDPDVRLGTSVGLRVFRLNSLILRELRARIDSDLTLPQFDVLSQLLRSPDGRSLGDLSRRLLVTAGNLTGIVDRLERDGLVHRERNPEDRRQVLVRLTDRGRDMVARAVPEHSRVLDDICRRLPGDELETLRNLLGDLKDRLEPAGDE